MEKRVHPQLEAVIDEFKAAHGRLHRLARVVPESAWSLRPDPARWSMGECVEHLNLTAEAYLPLLRAALEYGRRLGGSPPKRYRRDPIGWFMWRMAGPPVRYRAKTTAAFIPSAAVPLPALLSEFDRLQAEQISLVVEFEGLRLESLWITSPFDRRVRYNVYSCLTILPRHQERHIWQAEQVWSKQHQPKEE